MAQLSNPKSQILAKIITFVFVVALAIFLGQGGLTGSTVGDFGPTNKALGALVLGMVVVGGALMFRLYKKEMRE